MTEKKVAGRQLDAEIAYRVMGFQPVITGFEPSTRIEDAWKVVEKLRETNEEISFMVTPKGCAAYVVKNSESVPLEGLADTMPMALCIVALKAAGEKR